MPENEKGPRTSSEAAKGSAVTPDAAGGKAAKPAAGQKEEAEQTPTGTVAAQSVATPNGPMPVSAVTTSQEEAGKLLKERKERLEAEGRRSSIETYLSEEEIEAMDGATLRAVAHDRGYDLPQGGNRATRLRFAEKQDKDKSLSVA